MKHFEAYLAAENLGRELLIAHVEHRCGRSVSEYRQTEIEDQFRSLAERLGYRVEPVTSPVAEQAREREVA